MSAGQSTSQAAALAAFKSISTHPKTDQNPSKVHQSPERNVKRNPSGRLTNSRNATAVNAINRLPPKAPQKPQLSVVTASGHETKKNVENNRQRSSSPLPLYRTTTPKQMTSPSTSSASLPLNMIKSVKDSIEAKRHASEAKRLAQENQPSDMLTKIRQSINDRTRNIPNQAKVNERNMATINGIRESIELKRITTQANSSMIVLDTSSNSPYNFAPPDELRSPYEAHSPNYSYSSFESVPLAYSNPDLNIDLHDRGPETPSIVVDSPFNSQYDLLSPREDSDIDQERRNTAPILIPPSLNACARSANSAGSADDARSHLSSLKYQVEKEKNEDKNKKPKRKPPPELKPTTDLDGAFFSDSSSLNPGSSRSLLDAGSYLTDNESMGRNRMGSNDSDLSKPIKLPQYPELDTSSTKFKIRKRHGESNQNVGKMTELGSESDFEYPKATVPVSRATAPPLVHQKLQHVQLKTTMRDSKKKKKDKKLFDVDKPWKNHSDLDRISEADRKRYEGVWASNRGTYFNYVVTRINGIDYGSGGGSEQKMIVDEEDSMKAARLSAKQQADTVLGANGGYQSAEFHNITNAEISQLIHSSVVERIWERSRLPSETLRDIWELVDYRKDGTLNKPEFLVGMWLVDQCLYGRKLTKKVPASVWESLEGIGVSVKKKGKR